MGMSSPLIAGQVPNITSDTRRAVDIHSSPLSRNPSIAGSLTRTDSGLNKRAVTAQVGSPPTVIVRKKLPWLDGGQLSRPGQMPGAFDTSNQGSVFVTGNTTDAPAAIPTSGVVSAAEHVAPESRRASIASFGLEPSLRAVGSTPSLRQRPRSGEFKSISLNSDARPGVRPIMSKQQAKQVLGVGEKRAARSGDYTPSEYSTTPTSDQESMGGKLSKKDPAAYERLVQKAVARKATAHEPPHLAQRWFQAQIEVSPNDVAPDYRNRRRNHASSCRSCDHVTSEEPRDNRYLPRPLRQATSFAPALHQDSAWPLNPRLEPASPPPRTKTLHALPTHLMSPSSSSQDVTSQLMTSADESSPSPVFSPRAPPSANVSPRATLKLPPPATVKPRDLRRETRNLNRAVTGLEHLVDEAVVVANEATHSGRPDDVAHILESATAALRKASTTFKPRHGRMSEPLQLSGHESSASSASDTDLSDGDGSSLHGRASMETAPTRFTTSAKSSQPMLTDPQWTNGQRAGKEKVPIERFDRRAHSPSHDSIARTPPRLYQPPSADSIVRDFAYAKMRNSKAQSAGSLSAQPSYGAAADFYGDHGESVTAQPGIRRSIALEKMVDKPLPEPPAEAHRSLQADRAVDRGFGGLPKTRRLTKSELTRLEHEPTVTTASNSAWHNDRRRLDAAPPPPPEPKQRKRDSYYRHPEQDHGNEPNRKISTITDTRSVAPTSPSVAEKADSKQPRKHISLKEGQGFSLGRYHRRQPIAREWHTVRKRIAAAIACSNTVFIGLIAGIYAGEVPRIQYQIADVGHKVILGNVLLFVGLGLTTLIFWPLPLLHGRKPYTLMAFALMLPLQFPQALAISNYRDPDNPLYRCGLLIPRVLTGMAMGFANINQLPTLFDLFGVSLMSEVPHQEIVVYDDIRRQGGGVGIWLGIWSWCFVGSLSIGFCVGACIISKLDPAWGFYIVVILLAFFLLVNVIAPETRRAPYRRSIAHFFDDDEKPRRRVARGEVKLHISNDGPKWWFQEVWAGIILTKRMFFQPGFFVLGSYIAWIYAQVTLVILFLGALLSREYEWEPQYVGLASLSLAIGAFLAMPLAKASLFSRSRSTPQRTDSMTMRAPRFMWSSHFVRRCIFTLLLPFAGVAFTLSAPGPSVSWTMPTIFCGLVGFLSNLAIAECVGLIMETFDTCDLQPGVNQKHRLQSMAETTRRRRTNYSSFPRVCAGFFAAQALGFFLAAAATGVSGRVTRALGAQEATAITAGILLVVTVLLMLVLWRWKQVQVIPTSIFNSATKKGSIAWGQPADDPDWRPVIIGNPSGKMRRVNMLEMGSLSRWTEIRRLNKLIRK